MPTAPLPAEFWVPHLDRERATLLAVPALLPYHKAVREKLIRLLVASGQHNARIAGAHLDLAESQLQGEDFPDGWADQILACNVVKSMVLTGSPEHAAPADEDLAHYAMTNQTGLTLEKFFEAC